MVARRGSERAPQERRTATRDWRQWIVVVTFAAVFLTLAITSSVQSSATWDEPIHLTAGYVALAHRDYRIDPSHPPLLRIWAALPVLALPSVRLDTRTIDETSPQRWIADAYAFAHRFMYLENDADRMLLRARIMTMLLAVLLGILLFRWAQEWLGPVPALVVLGLFTLEPNLQAHGSLVTTDVGVTTFVFGTVYFLWRTCTRPTALNVVATATFSALAIVSKFSALFLAPVAVVLLAFAVWKLNLRIRIAVAVAALMAAVGVAAIWTVYGFRFLPSDSPHWAFDIVNTTFGQRAPTLSAIVSWIDAHHLLPNAYTQGLLYTLTSVEGMPAFLAGQVSAHGWWYFFPVAFLIKTPIAIIALTILGLGLCRGRSQAVAHPPLVFVLLSIAVFVGFAMNSGINLGIRHILPIYPFVLLIAGYGVRWILTSQPRWSVVAASAVMVGGFAEYASAYPHTLTFFNQFVGGSANGYRYLADSNVGWGSNLKRLKAWMDVNSVTHVNLAYFGQADPAYYRIDCTHLPGAPGFATDAIARPKLPGYVAISPTIMHGVYAPPEWRLFYAPFLNLTPVAVIGHSMRVYWVERWPEAVGPIAEGVGADAHRTLADALFFGMQWPTRAVLHYREYLRDGGAADAETLLRLGTALIVAGRETEGILALRAAVKTGRDHGPAHLMLGRALFARGELAPAMLHVGQAVTLMPDDADAHGLLGRIQAARGQYADAITEFRRTLQIDPNHPEARQHLGRLTGQP